MKFTSFTKEVHKHYSHFSYAPHLDCMEVEPPSEKKSFSLLTTVTNMAPLMPFREILVIEWQHNTWTNMIVKMIILRLLGSSDDKEKIGVARPEGPPLRCKELKRPWRNPSQRNQDRDTLVSPVEPALRKSHTSVHWLGAHQEFWFHWLNWR